MKHTQNMASVPADTKTSHGTVQDIMRPGFHHEPSQYQREKQHSSRVFRQITTKCTSHSYRLIRSFSAWSNIHTLLFLPQSVYTLSLLVAEFTNQAVPFTKRIHNRCKSKKGCAIKSPTFEIKWLLIQKKVGGKAPPQNLNWWHLFYQYLWHADGVNMLTSP